MGKFILYIKIFLCYIFWSPLVWLYYTSKRKEIIDLDIAAWSGTNKKNVIRLLELLIVWKPFRNLFYFRTRPKFKCIKLLCPEEKTLYISPEMHPDEGRCMILVHPIATRINALSIGQGCTFRNLTTIGVKSGNRHDERPIIGNNVDFGVNATCIGKIRIGDNAIIGAGAVVVKDVPDNAIVAGNPARIIRYRDCETVK